MLAMGAPAKVFNKLWYCTVTVAASLPPTSDAGCANIPQEGWLASHCVNAAMRPFDWALALGRLATRTLHSPL